MLNTTLSTTHLKQFIQTGPNPVMADADTNDVFAICAGCGTPLDMCSCVCPFCGERDRCECALFDAATGGWDNCDDRTCRQY